MYRPRTPPTYDSDASLSYTSDEDDQQEGNSGNPANEGYFDYNAKASTPPPREVVTCMWENCGRQFDDLQPLISHVHDDHVGVHKSTYTCEWSTCPRRGLSQTSRFALVSHLRSHTGEKPFTCPLPECDKSFTRSDALAKHMRLQHNISPPLPGRGNRKRKRPEPEPEEPPRSYGTPSFHGLETISQDHYPGAPPNGVGLPHNSGIKNEATGDDEEMRRLVDGGSYDDLQHHLRAASLAAGSTSTPPPGTYPNPYYDPQVYGGPGGPIIEHPGEGVGGSVGGEEEEDLRDLPPSLADKYNPNKATILGRSVPKVKYLVAKAKYRYLLAEHELLLDELELVRKEEERVRATKDAVLDRVLLRELGPEQADSLIGELHMPTPPAESMPPQPPPKAAPSTKKGKRKDGSRSNFLTK